MGSWRDSEWAQDQMLAQSIIQGSDPNSKEYQDLVEKRAQEIASKMRKLSEEREKNQEFDYLVENRLKEIY